MLLFTVIAQFLDVDELLSALVQIPKQETVLRHRKHILQSTKVQAVAFL